MRYRASRKLWISLVIMAGCSSRGTDAPAVNAPGSSLSYQIAAFHDPQNLLSAAERAGLLADLDAAVAQWGAHLYGVSSLPLRLTIDVAATTDAGRDGGTATNWAFLKTAGGANVFESCASYKLRTGTQGSYCGDSDITITINPSYLRADNFIDPDPFSQTTSIPEGKIDLVTVLAHELGHGFGIDGWLNRSTGAPPAGDGLSVYDSLVSLEEPTAPVFTGSATSLLYGGRLPIYFFSGDQLTTVAVFQDGAPYQVAQDPGQNFYHYGRFTRSGSDSDLSFFGLMAGSWEFEGAWRRPVGALEFAILKDLGLPVR